MIWTALQRYSTMLIQFISYSFRGRSSVWTVIKNIVLCSVNKKNRTVSLFFKNITNYNIKIIKGITETKTIDKVIQNYCFTGFEGIFSNLCEKERAQFVSPENCCKENN